MVAVNPMSVIKVHKHKLQPSIRLRLNDLLMVLVREMICAGHAIKAYRKISKEKANTVL